jgi:hypothetical protein
MFFLKVRKGATILEEGSAHQEGEEKSTFAQNLQ